MFDPWVGKIPWSRKWQPTPVLLTGKSHGQRASRLQSMGLQRVDMPEHTYVQQKRQVETALQVEKTGNV